MPLKYTGRADTLTVGGKTYAKPELYKKHPEMYDSSFDKAIPISQQDALNLINQSGMHSFETVQGEDLEDKVTSPMPKDSK